jgi:hypothetical protein
VPPFKKPIKPLFPPRTPPGPSIVQNRHFPLVMYPKPSRMEKIETVVMGPKWAPAFETVIAQKKEQAIAQMRSDPATVKV